MPQARDSIVGFTAMTDLPPGRVEAALGAQRLVVGAFGHLRSESLTVGRSRLEVWGHGNLSNRVKRYEDGSVAVLVGSPHGRVSLDDLPARSEDLGYASDVEVPWEGRVVLVTISADGRQWTLRNDWIGSIPVFHASLENGRVCSTIEPVVVAAAGCSANDIFLPGLLSVLINGHCLSDWTLFRNVNVAAPDSVATWDERGHRSRRVWTVQPNEDCCERAWDDLVNRMAELSRDAIVKSLGETPSWALTLSGGLDSRLIASVCADEGVDVRAFAWGSADTTDVACSREVARVLGLRWRHVDLGTDYLDRYTRRWASWFGTSLHFHGMYQMAFNDALAAERPAPLLNGFLGDILTASPLLVDGIHENGQLADAWHTHWGLAELESLLRIPFRDAFGEVVSAIEGLHGGVTTTGFKRAMLAELWSRQSRLTGFQATLADYWHGVATPFLNRAYAQFCFSLPRPALEHRRMLADVFRRHHGLVATLPGTYGPEPFIRTGRFLLKRRIADWLPHTLRRGPFAALRDVPPRMDIHCVQAHGWTALWPIAECRDRLAEWLDMTKIDEAFAAVMSSAEDMRPLRKLQSVQALACCLLDR